MIHLTFSIFVCQRLLDKVCCLFEVNADVEVVSVAGRYSVVDDARAGVVLSAGVNVHEGVSLRGVQDVGDAQTLQAHQVRCHKPAQDKEILRRRFSKHDPLTSFTLTASLWPTHEPQILQSVSRLFCALLPAHCPCSTH